MIVSHHGSYEFGSPKLPMTLEAVALHYLDNLDAKIHTFSREIRDDPSRDSSWTPFQQSLGRRLYKGMPTADPRRRRPGGLSPRPKAEGRVAGGLRKPDSETRRTAGDRCHGQASTDTRELDGPYEPA